MSITSVKSGATGISLALDNNFMEPIATTLVGSGGVNQVTFNDIPQTYKHLQIRAIARCAHANSLRNIALRINSDGGNNYADHYILGNGSATSSGADTSVNYMYIGISSGAGANANVFAANVLDILDYSNTSKYKTVRNLHGIDNNGDGTVYLRSGLWMDTSAVVSLSFTIEGGSNINQYSRFSLYGIKG